MTAIKISPEKNETSINLAEPDRKEISPLQFKLPLTLKKEFKIYATERNLTMTRLFKNMFNFYKINH